MTQLERERGLSQGSMDLIPLIETGAGLANAGAIARAATRVKRLAFGAGDFTLDLGLRWSREETELIAFRWCVVASVFSLLAEIYSSSTKLRKGTAPTSASEAPTCARLTSLCRAMDSCLRRIGPGPVCG